jgi:hypothetical protein
MRQFTFVGVGVVFEVALGGPLQMVGRWADDSHPPTASIIRTARPALAVTDPLRSPTSKGGSLVYTQMLKACMLLINNNSTLCVSVLCYSRATPGPHSS